MTTLVWSAFCLYNFQKISQRHIIKNWVHFWEIQFQNYRTLYQHPWQQHGTHLQKGCRGYVKLLLHCITESWRIWDINRIVWKTSAKTSSGQGGKGRGRGATARTSSNQRTTTGWWWWAIWYGCKKKIDVQRKTSERIQGDWKFK